MQDWSALASCGDRDDAGTAAGANGAGHFAPLPPEAPVVFSAERLRALVEEEVDQALARLPAPGDAGLRPHFLALLAQRLAEVSESLERPGVLQQMDAELQDAQQEMHALLSAVQPAPAVDLAPSGQAVLAHLETVLLPGGASAGDRAMLQRATLALVAAGVDTPARIDALLARARRHDVRLSVTTAAIGQLGYGAGFVLFNALLGPVLAPRLMGRGFWPAFGFGFCAGTLVGLSDAAATSALQQVADGMAHQGDPPLDAQRLRGMARISAGATFVKNGLSRLVLPTLVMALLRPEGMQRGNRNTMDLALDCLGGPPAGALGAWLRATLLDSPQGHALRMLSSADLDALIEAVQAPLAAGDIGTALRLFARGLARTAVAPSTYVVVLGVVAPMIGVLLAAQNAVPPGTLLLTQLVGGAGGQVVRSAGGASALPVRPEEHALRAGISTTLMSLMAGMATATGGAVGPRIDAPAFRCYVAALRGALAGLRAPAPVGEPGLRRRSIRQA